MTKTLNPVGANRFVTRAGRGIPFTAMGFGSAPLGNYTFVLPEAECDDIVNAVWNSGLRYFDTAPLYGLGLSEMRVGRLLKTKARDSYVLSTKVGRILEPCRPEEVNGLFFVGTPQVRFVYDYSYDGVMKSFESSLKRLGLDRVDILYVHDVDSFAHGGREGSEKAIRGLIDAGGWRALDEMRSAGVVSAIGAGVNEWQPCARLLELADPDLFLLAGRYTLLEQEPLDRLFPQCRARGVGVVVGGPYNSGILAGKDTYNYAKADPAIVERVKKIQAVADEHGVLLAAAALQFVLANPLVVSVIPGSQSVAEHAQNVAVLQSQIPAEFWSALKQRRLIHPDAPVPQ
jgi:D-threo-aldose 1-dehydrogenase